MAGLREQKKRQTREAIAMTAVRLFAERGYDQVTVADVASEAQVAVTTVFNYFKTKEDLFFGAFTPPGDLLVERLRDRPPGVSPVDVTRALLVEALDHMAQCTGQEHHSRIRAALATSQALQVQAMHRFRARRIESMDGVAKALTSPEPPDAFAGLVAAQLLGLVDGTMCEADRTRQAADPPDVARKDVRTALDRACAALAMALGDYGRRPTA